MFPSLTIIHLLLSLSLRPNLEPTEFDIPDAHWEPLFFKAINAESSFYGWAPLRESAVPVGGIEVRIWEGFGITGMKTYRVRGEGNQWRAYYHGPRIWKIEEGFSLESDWPQKWQKIKELGFLTLPDSSTLQNPVWVLDGTSYVVEINDGKTYRTYQYGNPASQKWDEADRLLKIMDIINHEFARAALKNTK